MFVNQSRSWNVFFIFPTLLVHAIHQVGPRMMKNVFRILFLILFFRLMEIKNETLQMNKWAIRFGDKTFLVTNNLIASTITITITIIIWKWKRMKWTTYYNRIEANTKVSERMLGVIHRLEIDWFTYCRLRQIRQSLNISFDFH